MEPAQVHKDLETLVPLFSCNDRDSIHRIQSKYQKFLNASGRSNAAKLFRDELSATIVPSDIPEPNLTPITTTGNGDCLFNAASLHIKGDETLASTIRLLSSCELFLNADYYADHPILAEASRKPGIISKDKNTLFSVLLTRHEEHELNLNSNNPEMYVKADEINMLKPRVWSSMLQVLSLANVLNCTVYSVYPDVNAAIRPLLNGSIFPIEKESGKRIFYVMWTRDGNLDSRPGSLFQPNHFCFVAHDHQVHVNTNGNTMSKRKPFTSSQQNEKKKLKVSSKGQLTMISFLQKKSQEDNTAGAKTDPEGKPAQDPSVEKDDLSVDDRNRVTEEKVMLAVHMN